MRYLKDPAQKRNDPVITWKQDKFTNIYPDLPASEIPEGGLADSENGLLFGDHIFWRPGDRLHTGAIALPLDVSQPFTSGIVKTGNQVTHSGNGFIPDHVGRFLIWDDKTASVIVAYVGSNEVTVGDTIAHANTNCDIRSPLFGDFWHEKTKNIFIQIGDRIFCTSWNFSGGWKQLYFYQNSQIGYSRSKFDMDETLIYIFNRDGVYIIDTDKLSEGVIMQMNMSAPPNTINPTIDEKQGNNTTTPYPPTSTNIGSEHNRFGRRYLFSLIRLDGTARNNKGDGTRLIKETPTNKSDETNDFKDFKESWRLHGFDKADQDISQRTYKVGKLDVDSFSNSDLQLYVTYPTGSIKVSIEGTTRNVLIDTTGLTSWETISVKFGEDIAAVFPEFPYISASFEKTTREILIVTGDAGVDFQSITDLGGDPGFDYIINGFYDSFSNVGLPTHRLIGTKTTSALKVPDNEYGYTHFSIYSTLNIGPTSQVLNTDPVNPEQFAWHKDIPIIKPFHAITDVILDTTYFHEHDVQLEDIGSWLNYTDGTKEQIAYRTLTPKERGANLYAEGAALKNNKRFSGFTSTVASSKLIDSTINFLSTTNPVRIGDLVVNQAFTGSHPTALVTGFAITTNPNDTLLLSDDIFPVSGGSGIPYGVGGDPVAIGSIKPFLLTKSGTTVKKHRTFTIVMSSNDKIDFEETTTVNLTTTISPGNYIGSALAALVKSRLELIGASTYTVTYNETTAKFTISSDGSGGGGILNLNWATGPNAPASIDTQLGFSADVTGSLTYTGIQLDSTFTFNAGHIGKTIFYADGTYDYIVSFTNSTTVEVFRSGTITNNMAAAFELSGRNYNDCLTDTVLGFRFSSFSALNRFYVNLPNSDIGAIVAGFIMVATDGEYKGYYSQYSNQYRYFAGNYQPEFQFFVLNDIIKEIQIMPNQAMVWCKNSTFRFQTNEINEVNSGIDLVSVLSGQGVVDENIGINDRMGVISYSTGQKIIVTSEIGVRTFSGYKYGHNMLMDEQGRSHVKKEFQLFKDRIVAYYEPNLYGLMLWGNDDVFTQYASTLPLQAKATKCYRMALEVQQGFGWAKLNGGRWPFIELTASPLLITDGNGTKMTIFFDEHDGRPHRLSTRKIPNTGASNEIDLSFADNEPISGPNGVDNGISIPWKIKLMEHLAEEEEQQIRYQEEHWYLRPYNEQRKSTTTNNIDYDKYGFRNTQKLTIKAFTDGNATKVSEVHTVDPKATINQPYRIENRRIQIQIEGLESEGMITGTKARYDVLKQRVPPGSQDEVSQQRKFSAFDFRISRGYNKALDLATGKNPTTGDWGTLLDTGPDGILASPISILNQLSYPAPVIIGERVYIFNFRWSTFNFHPPTEKVIYREDNGGTHLLELRVIYSGGLFILRIYDKSVLKHSITITGFEWYSFMIRYNTSGVNGMIVYSKSDLNQVKTLKSFSSTGLSSSNTLKFYKSDLDFGNDFPLVEFHDFQIFGDENSYIINEDLFTYYVRDLFTYHGESLIPKHETNQVKEIEYPS